MVELVESKQLDLNTSKSSFIIAGRRKAREKLQEQVDSSPLLLYNVKMSQVKSEKYLGIWLSETAADSVSITVNKRIGVATRTIFEIRSIIEDCRAEKIGGILLAFQLFEAWLIPSLLYGFEALSPIPKSSLKKLNDLSNKFLKVILGLGNKGNHTGAMYWMTGVMLMDNRILYRKAEFVHHLATLPSGSLGNIFYHSQKKRKYPGIVTEMQHFYEF